MRGLVAALLTFARHLYVLVQELIYANLAGLFRLCTLLLLLVDNLLFWLDGLRLLGP